MNRYAHRSHRGSMLRALSVIFGVAVNVLLAYISYRTGLPIYLDTIGTIYAALIGGLFPGITAAILTNAICAFFISDAIYFGIINAMIAIFTAWFVRERSFRSVRNVTVYIIIAGLISGGCSAAIQWWFLGGAQNASFRTLLEEAEKRWLLPKPVLFTALNILLNTVDKGVCLALTLLALLRIPPQIRESIRNSGWRQRPLTPAEIRAMNSLSGDIRYSLKRRLTVMFLLVTLTLTVIMGWIGIRLYFRSAKQEKTEIATAAAKFAADIVEPLKINDFIQYGEKVPGYTQTKDLLYKIRDNAAGVKYLYIVQIREDGCHVAFDLETEDTPAYEHGDVIAFEEAFDPYLEKLFAGEEIEPIESNDISGWVLTAYYPIRDSAGKCVGYAGADVSLAFMADYMSDFLLRVFLILGGFFLMVLAYALWTTGIYMVYPINNIVAGVEGFIRAGADQEALDESVRALRAIDIHTGDEVEKLYHAICDMAANQTEQLRSIRRFSENTEKMQEGLIITMADLVENRDSDTGAHIQKTAAYVKIIVEGLRRKGYYAEKITPKFISDCVRSAPLHDVGKINIPDSVLNKPGKLTNEEYEIIKTHTTAGRMIMEKAISTVEGENYLKEALNMAAYHHERWDGKGYPEGLHGEVIPLSARIMAVADVFDALASPRVYKPAFPLEKAISIIQEGAGTQFDPKCVEVFMEALPEVRAVLQKYHQSA